MLSIFIAMRFAIQFFKVIRAAILLIAMGMVQGVYAQTLFGLEYSSVSGGTPMVKVLTNGNYVVAGNGEMFCLTPWGGQVWSYSFTPAQIQILGVTEEGTDLICVGSNYANPLRTAIIFRLDSALNLLSQKEVILPVSFYAGKVLFTSDNNILIAGGTATGSVCVKLDSSWNYVSGRQIQSGFGDIMLLQELSNGDYLIGTQNSTVVRTDTAMNVLWEHAYDASMYTLLSYFSGASELPSGNLVFSGSQYYAFGEGQIRIVKTNSGGVMLNDTTVYYSAPYVRLFSRHGTQDSNNELVLSTNSFYYDPANPNWAYYNGGMARVDTNGIPVWFRQYPNTGSYYKPEIVPGDGFILPMLNTIQQTNFILYKTDDNGITGCQSATAVPVAGPAATDTSYGIVFSTYTASVAPTSQLQLMPNTHSLLFNCFLGYNEIENDNQIRVYPNPVNDDVIHFETPEGMHVESAALLNSLGQIIETQVPPDGSNAVKFASMKTDGVYNVVFWADGVPIVKRIVLVR